MLTLAFGRAGQSYQGLRNDYWGTTNQTQIEEWILDYRDGPKFGTLPVAFLPFLEQPVSIDTGTVGRLDARLADLRCAVHKRQRASANRAAGPRHRIHPISISATADSPSARPHHSPCSPMSSRKVIHQARGRANR